MRHILLVDPLFTNKYHKQIDTNGNWIHQVPALTLDTLPREQLGGILFYRLTIYANAEIQQEALAWVLSMLRDVKDEPSGIGN